MYLKNALVAAIGSLVLSVAFSASDFAVTVVNAAAALDPCEPPPPGGGGGGEARPAVPKGLRIIPGPGYDFDSYGLDLSGPFSRDDAYEGTAAADIHTYFTTLSLRSDCLAAYSLRNNNQVLAYMDHHRWIDVSYDPGGDPDPRRQDAAKIVVPAGSVSLPNNVRVPIPPVGSESLFVTWDAWMGAEFAYAKTGIGHYKHFQLASGEGTGRIWTEIKSTFSGRDHKAPAGLADVEVRLYGQPEEGLIGPNVTNVHPASPMVGQFAVQPETWTRYWALLNPVGEWHEFSVWVADTGRNPVQIIDRLQIKPVRTSGRWVSFWLEYNSSSNLHEKQQARVSYARNIVMLRGVTNVQGLLQRP
jgi:hypothetical protein